jgi:outer membrane protein TolC
VRAIIIWIVAALCFCPAGCGRAQAADGGTAASTTRIALPSPGDSLSLTEAVRLMLETHPSIHQALAGVKGAEAQIDLARTGLDPSVAGEATFVRLDPVSTLQLGPGPAAELFPHDNYDLHLGAGKKLYDFGRTATAVQLAESGLASARDNVETARWTLANFAASTFHLILILRENVGVLEEEISTLDEHLRISQKRLETGSATRLDVLTTQVRLASAKNGRLDVGNSLETQEILFRQLLGWPAGTPVRLRGNLAYCPVTMRADSLVRAAMEARPELRLAQDAESTAMVAVRLAALGAKPSVGLGVAAGFKNGFYPNLEQWRPNWAGSLKLEVPLFEGHRTRYQTEAAEANLHAAEAHRADLVRRITTEVEQSIALVAASAEKIQNARVQQDRAEEAVSVARAQYAAGVATNLDLLDAETSLAEARLLLQRAEYDYVKSLDALDRATGRRAW